MSFPRIPLLAAILLAVPLAPAQTSPRTARHKAEVHRRHERLQEKPLPPSAWNGHPRLAIVLVLDNFQGEDLQRWRADFQKDRGFDLFLDEGAYFPDCYYDYANNESAPGNAAISTGAYTDANGISGDSWWNLSLIHI